MIPRALAVAALAGALLTPVTGAPAAATDDCAAVSTVFARGSGQPYGDREATRWFEQLGATADRYELVYPAVRFEDGGYRASVDAGVQALQAFVADRAARCPGERFLLAGFSQGAQVTGEALPGMPADRIAFVALFGDPTLYLPEGRGPFPPACRGEELSPWRRGSVGCLTDNGILGARIPYLPAEFVDRTGSWCDRDDPACNANPADVVGSTHGEYALPGAEIDEAAAESVGRL